MLKKQISVLEEKIRKWVMLKKYSLILFLFIFSFIILTLFIPYLNLLVNTQLVVFLIITSGLIVFKASIKKIMYLGIFLFILAIPLVLLRDYTKAEFLINIEYGFLFVSLVFYLLRSGREDS